MDNRTIHIALWDMPNGETARVSVAYPTLAGLDRVYRVVVQPVTLEQRDGYTVERYEPRRGYRATLEASPRFNRRRLEALAEAPTTFDLARGMFARCVADLA